MALLDIKEVFENTQPMLANVGYVLIHSDIQPAQQASTYLRRAVHLNCLGDYEQLRSNYDARTGAQSRSHATRSPVMHWRMATGG